MTKPGEPVVLTRASIDSYLSVLPLQCYLKGAQPLGSFDARSNEIMLGLTVRAFGGRAIGNS